MVSDLEHILRDRAKTLLDPLECDLTYSSLTEFLLIEYILILSEKKGFGGSFKLKAFRSILDNLDLKEWGYNSPSYQTHIQGARTRIYTLISLPDDKHLLDIEPGQTNHQKSKGFKYMLPKNEEELDILKNWYKQRVSQAIVSRTARNVRDGYKKKQTQSHLFSQKEYNVFFGPNDGGPIVIYHHVSHVFTDKSFSAYVIFARQNESVADVNPREISTENTCIVDVVSDFPAARLHGQKSSSPICYLVGKGVLMKFLREISDFRLDEGIDIKDSGIDPWMLNDYI